MAENWLMAWWSKLIKSPFIVRRQMRRRARKIEHLLPLIKEGIYSKIRNRIKITHEVTRATEDQKRLGGQEKKVEKAEYELGMDEEIMEVLSLKEVKKIESTLLEHEERHGSLGYETEFGEKVLAILVGEEREGRTIYFTYLEPIIKAAEKGDHQALMEKIRALGPSQTNLFASIALRLDIRASGIGLSKIRHDKAELEGALREWDNSKGDKRSQSEHIRTALLQIEKDVQGVLHSDGLVEKRDFLLVILTLKYMHDDEEFMREYIQDRVMPRAVETLRINNIEELERKFGEDAHTLSQGMRRIFALEEDAEKFAKKIEAVARSKRAKAA